MTKPGDTLVNFPAEGDQERSWTSFCNTIFNFTKVTLEQPKKKHQDWFDEYNTTVASLPRKLPQAGSVTNSRPPSMTTGSKVDTELEDDRQMEGRETAAKTSMGHLFLEETILNQTPSQLLWEASSHATINA